MAIDAPWHRLPVPPNQKWPASVGPQKIVLEAPSPWHQLAPFAKATKQQLLSGKPAYELVHLHKKDLFDCQVSKGAIEEVCQLLDAIERVAAGYALTLVPGEKTLEFVHDGQSVTHGTPRCECMGCLKAVALGGRSTYRQRRIHQNLDIFVHLTNAMLTKVRHSELLRAAPLKPTTRFLLTI